MTNIDQTLDGITGSCSGAVFKVKAKGLWRILDFRSSGKAPGCLRMLRKMSVSTSYSFNEVLEQADTKCVCDTVRKCGTK